MSAAAATSAKSNIARGIGRLTDLVFTSGKGSYVQTTCGQTLLDFTTGIGVVNTGHCHPRVVAAAKAQCDNIIHSQVNIGYHDKKLELTDTLMPLLPKHLDTIFYGTTGAEAVENSIKMAKAYTGKPGVIVFRGGYHGRTFGTMAMTVSIIYASICLFVVFVVWCVCHPQLTLIMGCVILFRHHHASTDKNLVHYFPEFT